MNSTTDLVTSFRRPPANSDKKIAASTAIGTASASATPATHSEPTSDGRKPKLGGVDVGNRVGARNHRPETDFSD